MTVPGGCYALLSLIPLGLLSTVLSHVRAVRYDFLRAHTAERSRPWTLPPSGPGLPCWSARGQMTHQICAYAVCSILTLAQLGHVDCPPSNLPNKKEAKPAVIEWGPE